ncbi:hypothetical protein GOBAR_DD11528 [Gossypium barbadense]|nr:hypothetical protein GOBAR_DD11528 [Gossypium barbadense]
MESQTETHRKQKKWLRLLLFPLPLQGHVSPMLQLANLLYSKGFSITIIHTCFIRSPKYPSNNPHFTFHSIPNGLSKSECSDADNLVALVSILNANCAVRFVIAWLNSIAKSLQLPRFVLRTNNISSFLALAALALLQEKGYLPIQESQEEKPVIELPPLKVKDIPVFKTQDQERLHQTIAALVEQTKSYTGLIWNSFEELEHGLLSQDQSAISWLNKQAPKSVIYNGWNHYQKGFMEEIKERGHVVKWAPQQEVLAHTAVGGFWTHSGWNSTLESISEGVPMICHPCFGDQRVNARYVSDVWRIGVHLESKVDRFEIANVVRKLLVEAEGHEIRDRILQFKKMANQSTQQQGSSYRSLESLVSLILSSQSQRKL